MVKWKIYCTRLRYSQARYARGSFAKPWPAALQGDRKQKSGDRPVVVWVELGRTFIKYMGGLCMETMRVATQACNYTAQLFRSKSMRKSLKKVQILLAGTCNLDLDQYNILNEIELSKVLFRVQSSLVLVDRFYMCV